ncbi:putative serine protease inhibitor [Namao virus]|nr:putative serine protease inhibitor [Namao virus]
MDDIVQSINKAGFCFLHVLFKNENLYHNVFFSPMFILTAFNPIYSLLTSKHFKIEYADKQFFIDIIDFIYKIIEKNHINIDDQNQVMTDKIILINRALNVHPVFKKKCLSYLDYVETYKKSEVINTINTKLAHRKIENKLTEDDLEDELDIINVLTVYFQGKWKFNFPVENTRYLPFYVTPVSPVMTNMMMSKEHFYCHSIVDNYETIGIKMDFVDDSLSMYILMPVDLIKVIKPDKTEYHNGIYYLCNILTLDLLYKWIDVIRGSSPNKVILTMPRFNIDKKYDLKTCADAIGIYNIDNVTSKDAPCIIKGKENIRSKYFHHCRIEITEGNVLNSKFSKKCHIGCCSVKNIVLNRPFVFFIVHTPTKCINFIGKYETPCHVYTP